jgi:hypothetical protein
MRQLLMAAALSASLVLSSTARADDAATAETLFNEGRRLMQNEDYAKACPMLAESQRLDPGLGTQFNLADCYEHVGKTATAWAIFLEVAAATKAMGQNAREQAARQRADALASKLSHLVIAVPTSHARGLVVKKDGVVVGPMQWGIAIPVDPGPHEIQMSAPGRKAWESSIVVLPDGLTMALPVPNLATTDGGAAPEETREASETTEPGAPEDSEHPVPRKREQGGLGTQATAAIALGGVGALGLIVGTAAGLVSLSKHNESNNGCTNNVCTPEGGAARDGAIHAGNWSTAAFAVGIVAGAAGVVLWVTRPTPGPAKAAPSLASVAIAPILAPGAAGGSVVCRW